MTLFLLNHSKVVPISEFKGDFEHKSKAVSDIQFPVVLAWAITIPKCQGMTLDRAVIDIGYSIGLCGNITSEMARRSHILCNTSAISA